MVALVMACSFLLTACGGDNGELAGEYRGVKDGQKWLIKYDKKDNYYTQIFIDKNDKGEEVEGVVNSHLKRDGDWLGDEDDGPGHEKYFIRIIDKNTLQWRDDEKDIYKRIK
ncbi:hypothetical protein IQ454_004558 [Salmonella enterica]|nr:hypothetical protein [Salmonella enterica]EGL4359785.1 hypothetical protein [Salmonella enterica]EGL4382738.1 hypothetical protein [Salmonella enterica]EGL4487984.1 hypothetical protein [Salmonella enterica]EGL4515144.1 hypothetical protein [Salmonella enterica]